MYVKKVLVRESKVNGNGVFADELIERGSVVWKYKEDYDKAISIEKYELLDDKQKAILNRIAYLSPTSNLYVYPPQDDPAIYTNHSNDEFNISVVFDKEISSEPFFVSNRVIEKGEELLNNYHDFDEAIKRQEITPGFLKKF